MAYVDGFILPMPKKNVEKYTKIAKNAGKVWMKFGAIGYCECMADDVKPGKITSFPQSVNLKSNEVVFFSWIMYKNKASRDRINKQVMAHFEKQGVDMSQFMPFDGMRMIFGGFKPLVQLAVKKTGAGKAVKKTTKKNAAKKSAK